jgi:hypothetical protein
MGMAQREILARFTEAQNHSTPVYEKSMKTTPSKTTQGSHCLPPEAYMRLWNASVKTQQTPKFKSTYTPKKK